MSYSGEVYAEVEASVVNNGISPMAMVSGNPEPVDGKAIVVVWIRWRYNSDTGEGGYTGTSWYFDDSNNGLHEWESEEAFKAYLVNYTPSDLSAYIGEGRWEAEEKAAFLNTHKEILSANECLYFATS